MGSHSRVINPWVELNVVSIWAGATRESALKSADVGDSATEAAFCESDCTVELLRFAEPDWQALSDIAKALMITAIATLRAAFAFGRQGTANEAVVI